MISTGVYEYLRFSLISIVFYITASIFIDCLHLSALISVDVLRLLPFVNILSSVLVDVQQVLSISHKSYDSSSKFVSVPRCPSTLIHVHHFLSISADLPSG